MVLYSVRAGGTKDPTESRMMISCIRGYYHYYVTMKIDNRAYITVSQSLHLTGTTAVNWSFKLNALHLHRPPKGPMETLTLSFPLITSTSHHDDSYTARV